MRLSSRKAARGSLAPSSQTGNPDPSWATLSRPFDKLRAGSAGLVGMTKLRVVAYFGIGGGGGTVLKKSQFGQVWLRVAQDAVLGFLTNSARSNERRANRTLNRLTPLRLAVSIPV
jgi:hypothetical protein